MDVSTRLNVNGKLSKAIYFKNEPLRKVGCK